MRHQLLCALAALASLAVEAAEPLGRHRPSLESVALLREADFAPLAVGDFNVDSAAIGDMRGVTVRFHRRTPADERSLASHLKSALVSELKAAGKYDSDARTVIEGELVQSGLTDGHAVLAARFRVRSDRTHYEQLFSEESRWKTEYLGEVAIQDAMNQYTALYGKILMQLFQDEAFKTATK